MTTSPYDSLPTGRQEEHAETAQYRKEFPEDRQTEQTEEGLHYVDVAVDSPAISEAEASAVSLQMPSADPQDSISQTQNAAPQAPAPKVSDAKQQAPAPKVSDPKQQAPAPHLPPRILPMEKPPQYTEQTIKNLWGWTEYVLPFEETLLVPDTMPDMEKLLFTEGRVKLSKSGSTRYTKDDLLVGDLTIYTVYQPTTDSGSPVDVVKSSIPFKTDKCWSDTENAAFYPEVSIESLSADSVNERKFIVKGRLLIRSIEIVQKLLKSFRESQDENLALREDALRVTDLDFEMQETTEISQDINIGENLPSPIKILKESIRVTENHHQITSGKLVINGSIHSQLLYLGEEDGQNKLCSFSNKTDFTQFVLVKDDADANLIRITFAGDDLGLSIEDRDRFLLQGKVVTSICGFRNRDTTMVSDAYHKLRDLHFTVESRDVSSITDTVSGEISAREVLSLAEGDRRPAALLCGCGQNASVQCRFEKGRAVIEGSMPVTILALDDEDKPFTITADIPLRGSLETAVSGEDLTAFISSSLKNLWFDEINSRQLEINISLSITLWICQRATFDTLENMSFTEEERPTRRVSMAVYITSAGDTLWDVAKHYKCDADVITRLNQLDPEKPLPEGMKLLICRT